MTRDHRQAAIWGGAAALLLIIAGVLFSSRAGTLAEATAKADALYADYRRLYPEQGMPADEALASVRLLRDHQAQARSEAEKQLVATLPSEYQRSGVSDAASTLGRDVNALKQRAERQRITLPSALPYITGLDQDPAKSSLQLANLYLYRQVLDLCMDAGVTTVKAVKEGKSHRDLSGLYAVVTCELTVEGSYEALTALLDNLRAKHDSGIGIRELRLAQAESSCTATLVTSLLTLNNPAWQLAPAGESERRPAAGEPPPRRTRLGGG